MFLGVSCWTTKTTKSFIFNTFWISLNEAGLRFWGNDFPCTPQVCHFTQKLFAHISPSSSGYFILFFFNGWVNITNANYI